MYLKDIILKFLLAIYVSMRTQLFSQHLLNNKLIIVNKAFFNLYLLFTIREY